MARALLAVLLIVAPLSAASAQSVKEIERREAAVIEAWQATPLTVKRALFVVKHPDGYGMYEERPQSVFKIGEKLVTYAEPIAYGWKDLGNGMYEFGFVVDFLIKSPNGKVLAGKRSFARLVKQSHLRNQEFMLVLTLDVSGADPGNYVLEYDLHDIASDKSTSFDLPFTLVK